MRTQTNAGGLATHTFQRVPGQTIPRSAFDMSRGRQTDLSGGDLQPVFVEELVAGDTITISEEAIGWFTTMAVPIMHPVEAQTHYFAIPVRLVVEYLDAFHGAQDDPSEPFVELEMPEMTVPVGGFERGGLMDHLGVPPGVEHDWVTAIYARAYNLTVSEWYRDQDLVAKPVLNKDEGPDDESDYPIRKRAKKRDYFSAARPWPQKGNPVSMPLGTSAPVEGSGTVNFVHGATEYPLQHLEHDHGLGGSPTTDGFLTLGIALGDDATIEWGANTGLQANLTDATAATINQLREAFAIQSVLEIDSRSGTRLVEHYKAHFGVHPPDYRMMRPEYLGAASHDLVIHPVAQTAQRYTGSDTPPADLTAYAQMRGQSGQVTYSAVEDTIILGIANVRADISYQEGLARKFTRRDRWDHYLPSLAHLGEQAILRKEIYADGTAGDEDVWGYIPRWDEMRYAQSEVTGLMRSTHPLTLHNYHLALFFDDTAPALNEAYIEDAPPFERALSVTNQPDLRMHYWFRCNIARPMPTHSIPGVIGRF